MKLIEKIIKRNTRKYLREMDLDNRRESKNVIDRRGRLYRAGKAEEKALKICREIQPELKKLKQKHLLEKFIMYYFRSDGMLDFARLLESASITNSGEITKDFESLQKQLKDFSLIANERKPNGEFRMTKDKYGNQDFKYTVHPNLLILYKQIRLHSLLGYATLKLIPDKWGHVESRW